MVADVVAGVIERLVELRQQRALGLLLVLGHLAIRLDLGDRRLDPADEVVVLAAGDCTRGAVADDGLLLVELQADPSDRVERAESQDDRVMTLVRRGVHLVVDQAGDVDAQVATVRTVRVVDDEGSAGDDLARREPGERVLAHVDRRGDDFHDLVHGERDLAVLGNGDHDRVDG